VARATAAPLTSAMEDPERSEDWMDETRFDQLVRDWMGGDTRRSLLRRLSAVPLVGGLAGFLALDEDEDAEAKKKNKNKNNNKNKGKKHKRRCRQAKAQACDGKCGTVTVKCKKGHKKPGKKRKSQKTNIDCGPCCEPPCGACLICDAATTTCVADPEQTGDPCGFGGLCQADGACECDATSCPANAECVAGSCVCDTGFDICGDACVDLQTDPDNCGECGETCSGGAECVAGECACPSGQKNCNGTCIPNEECCGVCVRLAWNTPDADLDTHVWPPSGTPEIWFEFLGSVSVSPFIALDIDDQTAPGLEQVSIAQLLPGTTSYAVVNYDACTGGGTSFGATDATVTVTNNGTPLGTFNAAAATGTGVWWNVFTINDQGTVTPINQFSNTPLQTSGQVCS
jgi:hypothetical protein